MKKLLLVAMLLLPVVSNAAPPNCKLMKRDETALACTIYYEARGAQHIEKLAVSFITINRSKETNKKLSDIVRQPGQYTFMKRRNLVPTDDIAWEESRRLAKQMLVLAKNPTLYKTMDFTKDATYYHDKSIRNPWNFTRTLKTANLVFYRDDNR